MPTFVVAQRTGTNAVYNTPAPFNGTTAYADNGLNQYTNVAGAASIYDARGNLTALAGASYSYDVFNRLIAATPAGGSAASLAYDALGRLRESVGAGVTTRFLYDGADMIGEYNASGALLRRYVHGPGLDEPLVWYEGAGTGDRRWLIADQLGSVVAVSNASGAALAVNPYDEYGAPGPANLGRFGYTGQAWLPEAQLYHYKARAYAPNLGRFLQSDPIGFAGMNLYAYVGNDPVNWVDPWGLQQDPVEDVIVVIANRLCNERCREDLERMLFDAAVDWVVGQYGDDVAQAGAEAVCAAVDAEFALVMLGGPGAGGLGAEGAARGLPGEYTFARISGQGALLGGGAGASATRYTNERTGARTYVWSGSAVFASPINSRGTSGVANIHQGLARTVGLGASVTYGSSTGPDDAPLSVEGDLISTPFAVTGGGGPRGGELGGGFGIGRIGGSVNADQAIVALQCD